MRNDEQNITITVVQYSEKALAVFGNTKPIRQELKNLRGKFNRHLRKPSGMGKTAGWIFSMKKADEIVNWVKNRPEIKANINL